MLGIYYKTIIRNFDTGMTVFQITPKESCSYASDGLVKCSGKIGIYTSGIPIEIDGYYDETKKEFIVSSDKVPSNSEENTYAILEYITDDLTEKQKKKISELSNNNLFAFIAQKGCASKLMNVFSNNVKASKMAKLIIRKVKQLKDEEEFVKELMSYGMPVDSIELLLRKEFTLESLDKNPYILMLKFGVPIDAIELYVANRLHFKEYSIKRLCGFLYDSMLYAANAGHTCLDLRRLTQIMNMRFKYHGPYSTVVDAALVNLCIDEMSDEVAYREVDGEYYVYLHHIWEEESIAVLHTRRLLLSPKQFIYNDVSVSEVESELGIIYNSGQRAAFAALRTSGIKILTGPPGSGKTATLKGFIKYFTENNNGHVQLAATTGMASKVMSAACSEDAVTVNIMLNVRPFDNTVQGRDLNDPVDADLIIIDEVSMLGLQLFSVLVKAVRNGSIVILVGDEDQLLSVDYGNVLHDLINSGVIDVYRLTEILRQSGTICDNAKKINNGCHDLLKDKTFFIQKYNDSSDVADDLKKVFVKNQSQILSPIKSGELSTWELNKIFQDNSSSLASAYGKKIFRIGDKIIMTKTNYDIGYINGDIGYIIGKNENQSVMVQFATQRLIIERQYLRDMELADAITIHKSQGSEFDDIHIILPVTASHMMTRRILYTGVTRAKKCVHIYAVDKSLEMAIDDCAERQRMTLLSKRIRIAMDSMSSEK